MPIENEQKIILKDFAELEDLFQGNLVEVIHQVYTPARARYRCINWLNVEPPIPTGYLFTFKERLGAEIMEQQCSVSEQDFILAEAHAIASLRKHRVSWESGVLHWDVDILRRANGSAYFAIAEAEMPPGETFDPGLIPSDLEPFIRFLVAPVDNRLFTNDHLADEEYARSTADAYWARLHEQT